MAGRRVNGQRGSQVLRSSAQWLADGHGVLLVTVVKTWENVAATKFETALLPDSELLKSI